MRRYSLATIESRYRIPIRLRQGYGGQADLLRNSSCKNALASPCYRIPESHCHSTSVILPATTSTSDPPSPRRCVYSTDTRIAVPLHLGHSTCDNINFERS